jgi:hypothetical protein
MNHLLIIESRFYSQWKQEFNKPSKQGIQH